MRNLWKILPVALLILAITHSEDRPVLGAADTTYIIKSKAYPDAGKSITVTQMKKQGGTVKVTDADGKTKETKSDITDEEIFTRTVLDKGDRKPKKFKQVFDKATYKPGESAISKPHEGFTILYELKDGKYEAAVDGEKELSSDYLAALALRVNTPQAEELFLPKKPVKVGESWSIDLKEVGKSFAGEAKLDESKSKAEGKLVSVSEKGGKTSGVIELKLYLVMTSYGKDKVDPPMIADFRGTLDGVIDGSGTASKLSLTGKIKGKIERTEPKSTLEIDSTLTSEEERSAEK